MLKFEYDYPLYRPPSEANSLIIQITLGCSHNKCTFCNMYKSKRFKMKSIEEIKEEINYFKKYNKNVFRVFLADGDALIIPTERLKTIITYINSQFPNLERISIYASPKSIQLKSLQELKELNKLGVKLAYLGVESGSDKVLKMINKGITKNEMIKSAIKLKEAGFLISTTIITGLVNKEISKEHILETADIISKINPHYLGILSLVLEKGTKIYDDYINGIFVPLDFSDILIEIKLLINSIKVKSPCILRSNHASNYISLKGTLPYDKYRLLEDIDYFLEKGTIKIYNRRI